MFDFLDEPTPKWVMNLLCLAVPLVTTYILCKVSEVDIFPKRK